MRIDFHDGEENHVLGEERFEQLMGFHAAPMLLGLKPASLLSFRKSSFEDFEGLLASYETCFACKGISVYRLAEGEEYVLLLFYRAVALEQAMTTEQAREMLLSYGYLEGASLAENLEMLESRICLRKSFPHEIGLFLGYPPRDVKGFIEHKGQDFVYSGYWKVYSNEQETRRLFEKYTACTNEFCRKLDAGASFAELLQAV